MVTQMLCDPQGIDIKNVSQPLIVKNGDNAYNRLVGMVATYYVSADGKTIDVEWYSPIQKAYYLEEGQFTFTTESTKFPRVVASVEGGNGTVSPERIDAGDDPVTVVFTPEVGYAVEKVTLNGVDALGTTATFSVTPKGENTVKAVKYNGHTITATGGVYNITIKAVENIIEVVYDEVAVAPHRQLLRIVVQRPRRYGQSSAQYCFVDCS